MTHYQRGDYHFFYTICKTSYVHKSQARGRIECLISALGEFVSLEGLKEARNVLRLGIIAC
jgi:hypothetical protein